MNLDKPAHTANHTYHDSIFLQWMMVQTMIPEVRKVFLVVAWGRELEEKWMYFTLYPSSTSATSPRRCFISLLLGDDGGDSSLLGSLYTTVVGLISHYYKFYISLQFHIYDYSSLHLMFFISPLYFIFCEYPLYTNNDNNKDAISESRMTDNKMEKKEGLIVSHNRRRWWQGQV